MSARRPQVVAFDVNETLLDLAPVRAALVELGQPADLLTAVFSRTLLTGFAAATAGTWCRFRDAFDAALAQATELGDDDRALVTGAFFQLAPHPDVEPALRRWGTHPSWSRLLGSPRLYVDIEDRLTALLGAPDTLVLPTITHIHMTVIPVIAGRGWIFLDGQAHKTIYEGCTVARGMGGPCAASPPGTSTPSKRRCAQRQEASPS